MTSSAKPPNSALRQVAHISALHSKISSLKESIRDELKRPSPDYLRLSLLKKRKVRLKDKVRRLVVTSADMPISHPTHYKAFRS